MKLAENRKGKRQAVEKPSRRKIRREGESREGTVRVLFCFFAAEGRGLFGKNRKAYAVAAVLFLFVFLACFCILWGGAREETLQGTPVVPGVAEDTSILLLEEQNGSVILACSGYKTALLLRFNADTGEIEARREMDMPLYWAALRDGTLFFRDDSAGGPALVACNRETLEEVSRRKLGFRTNDLAFFDCDGRGNVSYVFSQSRALLRIAPAEGGEGVREFPGSIEFLEAEDDGGLWVFAGKTLYASEPEGEFRQVSCLSEPYHLLGAGRLMDRDGVVYKLGEVSPEPLFRCPDTIYNLFSFCLDRENCLIVSKTGGGISRYGPEGENLGSCRLENTALAVCGAGGLYRLEGDLYYAAFSFSSATPSFSPSPSPTPEAEEPPARAEGNFILMPAGATADQLRELFKPEAVAIRDLKGNPLTYGRLATGMTAGDWVLVIEGDCNGTGTVNTADLREALSLSLQPAQPENPCYRAADLNDDGLVDTADLLLLSAMIS